MPPEPFPVSEVPEQVLPLEERQHPCIPVDSSSKAIIWYDKIMPYTYSVIYVAFFSPITEYRWRTSEWGTCSRSCSTGVRHRNITCIEASIPINSFYEAQLDNVTESVVEERMCAMSREAGKRPSERELCSLQKCPVWQTSQYSEVHNSIKRGMML